MNQLKRKWMCMACILIGAGLSACTAMPELKPEAAITFVQEAEEADVWIIPDTEQNRKTTVWGTATIAKWNANEPRTVSLDAIGGEGTYLIRMIGTDGMFYAADGIALKNGYTVRLRVEDDLSVTVEVTDENGAPIGTYSGFAAHL